MATLIVDSQRATQLKDLGINASQSSRWQQEATVLEDEFEEWLDSHKGGKFPTSSGLRNLAKRQAAEQEIGPHRTDSVSDLAALAESGQQFAVIYADPPWTFKLWQNNRPVKLPAWSGPIEQGAVTVSRRSPRQPPQS